MTPHDRRDRLSIVAGVAVMVFVVAACAIKLRDDEEQASSTSLASKDSNPLVTELARCRSVTPEQKDALEDCRRVWAEQRRQFFGKSKTLSHPDDNGQKVGFPASGQRQDQNQLPQGSPFIPKTEGE
jgi:conjugative transfer region protein TrbK